MSETIQESSQENQIMMEQTSPVAAEKPNTHSNLHNRSKRRQKKQSDNPQPQRTSLGLVENIKDVKEKIQQKIDLIPEHRSTELPKAAEKPSHSKSKMDQSRRNREEKLVQSRGASAFELQEKDIFRPKGFREKKEEKPSLCGRLRKFFLGMFSPFCACKSKSSSRSSTNTFRPKGKYQGRRYRPQRGSKKNLE